MFTGIISDIGEITELKNNGDVRARIKCNYTSAEIDLGASIACDGICLTVVDRGLGKENWFDVDISAETVSKTTISASANGWGIGRKINLERSLKVGDELGGHIVSGHVDGVATIKSIEIEGDSTRMTFEISSDLSRFIASKGSVSLNGTSLTVNEVNKNTFGVNLIVHPTNPRVKKDLSICMKHKVPIIITSLGAVSQLVSAVHSYGGLVFHDVIKKRHAEKAAEAGVDGLILVAAGAGGHGGTLNPMPFITEVRSFFKKTILLSGCISSGRDIASAIQMGADLSLIHI